MFLSRHHLYEDCHPRPQPAQQTRLSPTGRPNGISKQISREIIIIIIIIIVALFHIDKKDIQYL